MSFARKYFRVGTLRFCVSRIFTLFETARARAMATDMQWRERGRGEDERFVNKLLCMSRFAGETLLAFSILL